MSVVIHPTAVVSSAAELGDGVQIGPYCLVEAGASIGAGTVLKAFVSVHGGVSIGTNCRIHEYTAVGGDPQDHNYKGEASRVRIGNDNLIRENVTINRATGEGCETVVGNGCFIMDGVHLAHNVHLGNHITIANTNKTLPLFLWRRQGCGYGSPQAGLFGDIETHELARRSCMYIKTVLPIIGHLPSQLSPLICDNPLR